MIATYTDHKNSKFASGTCSFCKKRASLRSFDGKVGDSWFHVWEECSLCKQHDRLGLADYEADLASTLSHDRAKAEKGDRAAELRIARHLVEEGRWERASETIGQLRARTPEDPALAALEARIAVESTDASSWGALEEDWKREPENTALLEVFANALVTAGEHERAVEPLRELARREPGRWEHPLALGRSLFKVGRFEESSEAFERLFQIAPERKNGYLALEARQAREASGLTRDEWQARMKARSKRSTRIFLGVFLTSCAGLAAFLYVVANIATVVVDDPTDKPLSLSLDGKPWVEVAPHQHQSKWVWLGHHTVEIVSSERPGSYAIELTRSQTYVLDPLEAGDYQVYDVIYVSSVAAPSKVPGAPELHRHERFFFAGAVDDVFAEPPATQFVDSGQTKVRRVLARLQEPEGVTPR